MDFKFEVKVKVDPLKLMIEIEEFEKACRREIESRLKEYRGVVSIEIIYHPERW